MEFEVRPVLCVRSLDGVTLQPEMAGLLRLAAKAPKTIAVVLTCGLESIWQLVLDRAGLAHHVHVIGGGHARHESSIVVTSEIKAHLVRCLRNRYWLTVCAFSDGIADIPMLSTTDHAILMVSGPSKSLEGLDRAINHANYPLVN